MNLPHCPRCGGVPGEPKPGEIVLDRTFTWFSPWCEGCGFGLDEESQYSRLNPASDQWRRAVRAELARQALEMRAHGQAWNSDLPQAEAVDGAGPYNLPLFAKLVAADYEWLGKNPLRLPGEDA